MDFFGGGPFGSSLAFLFSSNMRILHKHRERERERERERDFTQAVLHIKPSTWQICGKAENMHKASPYTHVCACVCVCVCVCVHMIEHVVLSLSSAGHGMLDTCV